VRADLEQSRHSVNDLAIAPGRALNVKRTFRRRNPTLTIPSARVLNIRGVCLGLRTNSEGPAVAETRLGDLLIPFGFFRPVELLAEVSRIKVPDGVVTFSKGADGNRVYPSEFTQQGIMAVSGIARR